MHVYVKYGSILYINVQKTKKRNFICTRTFSFFHFLHVYVKYGPILYINVQEMKKRRQIFSLEFISFLFPFPVASVTLGKCRDEEGRVCMV
jgi:hypothetical protein